jgi:ubiquinone/menaquinone biosynthesis C-methylase UbiE
MTACETQNLRSRNTPNFDSIARFYRWMEYLSFGPMLERCRFRFLTDCAHAQHALVLGDGDGRFTARLLAANRNIEVDAVDASAAMLAQLRRRVAYTGADAEGRLRIVQADLRHFTPDCSGYDLVVSHFFLDCLTDAELREMTERIVPHLAPGATWLVSEFAIPKDGWRRVAARSIVHFLYFAFDKMTHLRVQELPDYEQIFLQNGFHRSKQAWLLGGLLVAEMWKQGAGADERLSST